MRQLLLAATLLYGVIAEFEGEKSYGATSNVETQSWPIKLRRIPWENIDHNFLPSTVVVNRSNMNPYHLSAIQMKNLQDLRKVTRYRSSILEKPPIVIIMYEYQESIDDRSGTGRIRRENHGWTVQEPFYVEEPSWIPIEDNGNLLGETSNENDPFFVTRGKKILSENKGAESAKGSTYYDSERKRKNSLKTYENVGNATRNVEKVSEEFWNLKKNILTDRLKENEKYEDFSKNILDLEKLSSISKDFKNFRKNRISNNFNDGSSSIPSEISLTKTDEKENQRGDPAGDSLDQGVTNVSEIERRKRDTSTKKTFEYDPNDFFGDKKNLEKLINYKIENEELGEIIRNAVLEDAVNFEVPSFVEPRNKHSGIQDIFDETFFISRGKKRKKSNYPKIRKNLQDSFKDTVDRRVNEEPERSVSCENFLKILKNWNFCRDPRDKRSKAKPPRNRRGMLDEILMRYDPFYVARGKRTSSRISGKSWDEEILEKLKKKYTNTDIVKFYDYDTADWSDVKNTRDDSRAWKEFKKISSVTRDKILEDYIGNTDNSNDSQKDDAKDIKM